MNAKQALTVHSFFCVLNGHVNSDKPMFKMVYISKGIHSFGKR